MGRVFLSQSDATEYAPKAGETLAGIVAAKCEKADPPISCDEVALFNWGTTEAPEVLRALVELVGCRKIDADLQNLFKITTACNSFFFESFFNTSPIKPRPMYIGFRLRRAGRHGGA